MRRALPYLIYPLIWIVIACADPGPTATVDESPDLRGGAQVAQNNDDSDDSDSDDDDEGDDDDGDDDDGDDDDGDDDDGDDDDDAEECEFDVPLQASQEVPPTTSSASGRAKVEIERSEIEFEVRIDNPARESFVAGHIHRAPRGVNGPVVRGLFPNDPQNEEFEAKGFPNGESLKVEGEGSIAPALAAEICAQPQQFYVNFHTMQFPGGAIRGQLR